MESSGEERILREERCNHACVSVCVYVCVMLLELRCNIIATFEIQLTIQNMN